MLFFRISANRGEICSPPCWFCFLLLVSTPLSGPLAALCPAPVRRLTWLIPRVTPGKSSPLTRNIRLDGLVLSPMQPSLPAFIAKYPFSRLKRKSHRALWPRSPRSKTPPAPLLPIFPRLKNGQMKTRLCLTVTTPNGPFFTNKCPPPPLLFPPERCSP